MENRALGFRLAQPQQLHTHALALFPSLSHFSTQVNIQIFFNVLFEQKKKKKELQVSNKALV